MYQTSEVKVYTITTGETFGADEELLSKVKRRIQLSITHWMESLFIIIFCPITSRVGSDVEAAMTKVPEGDQKVILVLMHHTRDEGYSTAGVNWSDKYRNVILDVHVLFHETKQGLLKCAKNTEAVDRMICELDQRSQNQQTNQIRPMEQGLIKRLDERCFPYWKIVLLFVVVVLFILPVVIFLSVNLK